MDDATEFRLQALLSELGWLEGLGILDASQREFLVEVRIGIEDAMTGKLCANCCAPLSDPTADLCPACAQIDG